MGVNLKKVGSELGGSETCIIRLQIEFKEKQGLWIKKIKDKLKNTLTTAIYESWNNTTSVGCLAISKSQRHQISCSVFLSFSVKL